MLEPLIRGECRSIPTFVSPTSNASQRPGRHPIPLHFGQHSPTSEVFRARDPMINLSTDLFSLRQAQTLSGFHYRIQDRNQELVLGRLVGAPRGGGHVEMRDSGAQTRAQRPPPVNRSPYPLRTLLLLGDRRRRESS